MQYVRKSFCGPIFQEELDERVDALNEQGFRIDEVYLSHIAEFHGGIPKTRFFGKGEIERILNFADSYSSIGARWRNFNVNVVRNWIKDRIAPNVFPFASLPHGAYLCFQYSTDELPRVVMSNNESCQEDYVPVSDTFSELLEMVSDQPFSAGHSAI